MDIYILRHGIAEEEHEGRPDADRALTTEGKKKLRHVLRAAAGGGVQPSLILTSPFRRAIQTAQLAAEVLDYKGELVRTRTLEPASSPNSVWDEIRTHKNEPRILLAGHEPLLSGLTAFLLGCPTLHVDFKKGGLACVEVERMGPAPNGVLKWYLIPKLAGAG